MLIHTHYLCCKVIVHNQSFYNVKECIKRNSYNCSHRSLVVNGQAYPTSKGWHCHTLFISKCYDLVLKIGEKLSNNKLIAFI